MEEGEIKFVVIKIETANIYSELFIITQYCMVCLTTVFQAGTSSHCSANGPDFQKVAILSSSELSQVLPELSEVRALSLHYQFTLISNPICNLLLLIHLLVLQFIPHNDNSQHTLEASWNQYNLGMSLCLLTAVIKYFLFLFFYEVEYEFQFV